MADKQQEFGLFKRGQDEPIAMATDADMLQRMRKREFGNSGDYKVAPLDANVTFAELPAEASSTAGLDIRKADIREKLFDEKLTEELRSELESEVEASADEALEAAEEADEGADDEKLTGDELEAKLEELGIDASTGGSKADGSMTADEKRAAIEAAEA